MEQQRDRYHFAIRGPLVELCQALTERYVEPVLCRQHGWRLETDARTGLEVMRLDADHRLTTAGPFRIVRNPIYAGVDLLALGTAIWISTWMGWLGVALMIVGGDLRARAEEPLLEVAFGDEYRDYRRRTSRLIPGLY